MRSHRSGSARTNIQDTPQEARYLERAPSAPITGFLEAVHCTTVQCTARWAPNGGPKMCVWAGDGLVLAPSGRAHHSHLSSLARDGFAHLCTDFGVGLAPGQASSSPLSAEPSIRFCPDIQTGHSSGSALFRKGTFGADNRKRGRSLYYCTVYGRWGPKWRPENVRNSGRRSRARP